MEVGAVVIVVVVVVVVGTPEGVVVVPVVAVTLQPAELYLKEPKRKEATRKG